MVLFATELEFKEEPGQGQFLKLAKKGHNVKFDNDERQDARLRGQAPGLSARQDRDNIIII